MNSKAVRLVVWMLSSACISGYAQTSVFTPMELINVVDSTFISIKPCNDCKAMAIIFTSLKCPYDKHYSERIKKLVDQYGGDVSFFLVNSNPEPDEQPEKMKAAYSSWRLSVPFLADKDQVVASALNAHRTPEAFLIKKEGTDLRVVYHGALDDNPQVHHDTNVNFLENAIKALLSGKNPAVASERVIGCTIRKK